MGFQDRKEGTEKKKSSEAWEFVEITRKIGFELNLKILHVNKTQNIEKGFE